MYNVNAPLNIGHKANIVDHNGVEKPWHDQALPPHLVGISDTNRDSPFSLTGLLYDEYTSIASCVPVRSQCE